MLKIASETERTEKVSCKAIVQILRKEERKQDKYTGSRGDRENKR